MKASISLSINFIVVLIISLVVMGFGFGMLKDVIFNYDNTLDGAKDDLINSLNKIMSDTDQPVYIFPEYVEVEPGKTAFFAVGVNNVYGSADSFTFEVNYQFAQDEDGTDAGISNPPEEMKISNNDDGTDFYFTNNIGEDTINQQEKGTAVVGIKMPDTVDPYTYVYQVDVYDSRGNRYGDPQLVYVRVI